MEISFERATELVLLCGTWFLLLVATRRQLTIQYLHRQFFARFAAQKVYPGSLSVTLQCSELMTATDTVSQRLGYQPVPAQKRA